MERHSLPDDGTTDTTRGRRPRRRTVLIATALVLSVAAATGIAARNGLLSFAGGCTGSAVRVDLAASPDIAPAVRAVADSARRNDVTSDGRCVDVRVVARENYEIADDLATGTSTPDYEVWLPDSDVWVERALDGGDGIALTSAGNAATSPVVLAAVPAAGTALGWPEKTYTWAELTATADGEDAPRLGAADPARSATGLLAFSSVVESARKADPDSDTRIAATAEALAERVSESDGQVVRSLVGGVSDDARDNEAVFLTEQAAFTHNSAGGGAPDLQLLYPTDAAPVLNYPLNLVNEPELTTAESRAAMRFISLLSEDGPQRTMADHGFRTGHSVVPGGLVRTAGGRAPQPYALTNARPPATEMIDEALGMWTVTVQDTRLTVVVDASDAMARPVPGRGGESRMDVTKASLLRTVARFTPKDEVGLWDFAADLDGTRDYRKLADTAPLGERAGSGATHRESLSDAVSALAPTGSAAATGLYDTTLAAFKEAQSSYVSGKCNVVVVLTGGPDTDAAARTALMAELRKLADPKRPVPLIAIAVGPEADREEMNEIARITGGAGYEASDPAGIQAVMIKAIMTVGANER